MKKLICIIGLILSTFSTFAAGEAEVRFVTEIYLPTAWTQSQYLPGGTAVAIDIFVPSVPQFDGPTALGTTMSTENVSVKRMSIVPFYKRIFFLEYEEFRDELRFLRPLDENDGVTGKDILAEVKQGGKTFNTMFAIGDKFTYINKIYTISEIRELTPEEQNKFKNLKVSMTNKTSEDDNPLLFVILEGENGLKIPVPFNVNISPKYYKLTFKDMKNGKTFYASYPGDIKICDKNGNIVETYKVGGLYENGVVLVDAGNGRHGVPKAGK